jgi:Secretion system C-terminal sorting domain
MKKYLLIGFFSFLGAINCQGQWIQQLWTNPSILTTNTPVQLIADVDFPFGGCSDKTLNLCPVGNTFSGDALHCLGAATFICNDKDTFNLGLLPAGTYRFYYRVDIGMGPSPCTPGIVVGPTDSLTFVVNLASSVDEVDNITFNLFPNPASSVLHLNLKNSIEGSYKILDSQGSLVLESNVNGTNLQIDISRLADALYTFIYEDVSNTILVKKFTKK